MDQSEKLKIITNRIWWHVPPFPIPTSNSLDVEWMDAFNPCQRLIFSAKISHVADQLKPSLAAQLTSTHGGKSRDKVIVV